MWFFPFSLTGCATDWYSSLEFRAYTTWQELADAFLNNFYLQSLTEDYHSKPAMFKQKGKESLYTAWEHFKGYQRECPHYGLSKGFLMSKFYSKLNPTTRMLIITSVGGDFTSKTPAEVKIFIETLTQNHQMHKHEVSLVQGVGVEMFKKLSLKLDQLLLLQASPPKFLHHPCVKNVPWWDKVLHVAPLIIWSNGFFLNASKKWIADRRCLLQ